MKTCTNCGTSKAPTDFHKKSSARDGLAPHCKTCCSSASKKYYEADKDKYKASARRNMPRLRQRNREFLWEYLASHPCVDCGCDEIVLLQFDHGDGLKEGKHCELANLASSGVSLRRLQEEIDKCEVRCGHCHTKKTYLQFGWPTPPDFKYEPMVP